jgi:GNAT superfamily N-acetyltransferase
MVDMDANTDMTVRIASREELPEALRVQRAGFRRVAARYGFADADLPPLSESRADLESLHDDGVVTFVALAGEGSAGIVVGTVRCFVRDDGVVEIGRLAVDDGWERRGVARALMGALEAAYPQAVRFELFTGSEASGALALYAALGYSVSRLEEFPDWTRVWLAKDVASATMPDDPPLH